jgi:pSer/pThr/pTyr-binding forkhead associated (FHA) protein
MAKLVIYEEFESEKTIFEDFDLTIQRILIGSSLDNQLVLDAPGIDPSHASLELRDEHWILQDLGGPGGTVVNGIVIEGPYPLHHGDLIELAQVKIKFKDDDSDHEDDLLIEEAEPPDTDTAIRGRVWFAAVAGATLGLIFVIVVLLIVADFLEVLQVTDLIPLWPG